MKIKTSELTGPALRWAVGMAEGFELSLYGVDPSIKARVPGQGVHAPWAPDFYWNQGGPIIERERINLDGGVGWAPGSKEFGPYFRAWQGADSQDPEGSEFGPTPLIAAMRCFVASKLGDEVDVPEELL